MVHTKVVRLRRLLHDWTMDDTMLLIDAVKAAPVIWKSERRDHALKRDQWQWISENVFQSRISINELNQKWQNLRSHFLEYLTKLRKRPNYNIQWLYYHKLSFLRERFIKEPAPYEELTNSTFIYKNTQEADETDTNKGWDYSTINEQDDSNTTNMKNDLIITNVASVEPDTHDASVQTEDISADVVNERRDELLNKAINLIPSRPSDESQVFGDYVAVQLRRLSPTKRQTLEYNIQKLLMESIDKPDPKIKEEQQFDNETDIDIV